MARGHPVHVAAHGIDLAVVRDHAERMRQIPGREGVGGEALMHQRQRADHTRVLQIAVVLADLVGQQHALVDDGARRQRGAIESFALRLAQVACRVLHGLADHEQLALECILIFAIFTKGRQSASNLRLGGVDTPAPDEHLAHDGFDLLDALAQA